MICKLTTWIISSLILSVVGGTLPYFIIGVDFLFLPLLLIISLFGLAGIIVIPVALYRFTKNKRQSPWLIRASGVALGFYISYLILQPIANWGENARILSGRLLSQELEAYKNNHGRYPKYLTQLNISKLVNTLPWNYKLARFNYTREKNNYRLEISIPITDRWQWSKEANNWLYR